MTYANRFAPGFYQSSLSYQRPLGTPAGGVRTPTSRAGFSSDFYSDSFVRPSTAQASAQPPALGADPGQLRQLFEAIRNFFANLFGAAPGGPAAKAGQVDEFGTPGATPGTPPSAAAPGTTTTPGATTPDIGQRKPPSVDGPTPGGSGNRQMWDVFFDSKEGTQTRQRSPIVLDLNGNGRPDITGSNIKGDGKIEGGVQGFDLNPSARQWETRSRKRRPGNGAPKLPDGTRVDVFDAAGKLVRSEQIGRKFKGNLGLEDGQRAEFRGPDGKLVGELKQVDGKGKGKFNYHWGNANQNEWTKPWDANGGDGILAWDVDGDGKITSGKELFGHVDIDGTNRFANGYEKLAAHFDRDGNGVVEGDELAGLKIWEDRNGDGVTQDGELVDLADRGITELGTSYNPDDMSATYNKK